MNPRVLQSTGPGLDEWTGCPGKSCVSYPQFGVSVYVSELFDSLAVKCLPCLSDHRTFLARGMLSAY